jgi:hypothetical protein
MLGFIRLFLGCLVALFRRRAEMAAENLALRHQLGILLRSRPARHPRTSWDRVLWAFVLHRFPAGRQSLVIVRPETVIAWHRQPTSLTHLISLVEAGSVPTLADAAILPIDTCSTPEEINRPLRCSGSVRRRSRARWP